MAYVSNEITKVFAPKKKKDPMEEIQNLINNKQLRISDAGFDVPEPKDNRNFLMKFLDIIDRPGNAVRNAIEDAFITKENSFLQGLAEGFTGKEHVYGSDLLEQIGVQNKLGKGVGGFALDVLLDPLTYFGGFLAKGAAKGLRAANLNRAAQIAEEGIVKSVLAPPVKNFARGISSAGMTDLPLNVGNDLMSELGQAIGNIPLGKDLNLGQVANRAYDAIVLPFNTKAISRRAVSEGIEGATSFDDVENILKQGAEDILNTPRRISYLENKAKQELADSVFTKMDEGSRIALRSIREAPVHMARRLINEAKEGNVDIPVTAAKKAHELLTKPQIEYDEFIKRTNDVYEKLSLATGDEALKLADEYNDIIKVHEAMAEAYGRASQEISRIAGGNAQKETLLRQGLNYLDKRNEALATVENMAKEKLLPDYMYHAFEAWDGDPKTVDHFFSKNKHLNVLNSRIAADNKRLYSTYWDIEKAANEAAQKNIGIMKEKMDGVFSKEEIESLAEQGFEEMVRAARRRGIIVKPTDLEPVIRPLKDTFHIQVARELDSARKVARKELIEKLKDKDLVKYYKDDEALIPAGWIKTDNIPGMEKGYAIHPELARIIKNTDTFLSRDENIQGLVKMYNSVQNMWKSSVTAWRPGWYQTTIFGNVFNGMLGGVYNPNRYYYAGMLQAGKNIDDVLKELNIVNKVIGPDGKVIKIPMNSKQLMDAFRQEGLEGFGQIYGDIGRTTKNVVEEISEQAGIKKKSVPKKIFEGGKQVGSMIETNAKLAMFLDQLAKGKTIKESAEHVRTYLFDYSDITRFEKGLKMFIPFYTFTRKNLPLQLKSLVERPDKYLAVERLRRASLDMAGMPEEDIEVMPEWLRERAFGSPVDGAVFTPLFPSDNISDFLSTEEPIAQPLRAVGTMVSPLIKTPLFELPANVALFTGQPIERYEGQRAQFAGIDMPAKLAYVLNQIGMGRDVSRAVEDFFSTKEQKGTVSPIIPLLDQTIREYHPERAKLYKAYDYDRQLEEFIKLLKDMGIDLRTATEIKKGDDWVKQLIKSRK